MVLTEYISYMQKSPLIVLQHYSRNMSYLTLFYVYLQVRHAIQAQVKQEEIIPAGKAYYVRSYFF